MTGEFTTHLHLIFFETTTIWMYEKYKFVIECINFNILQG